MVHTTNQNIESLIEEADKYFKENELSKAIDVTNLLYERLKETVGENHIYTLTTLNNLL